MKSAIVCIVCIWVGCSLIEQVCGLCKRKGEGFTTCVGVVASASQRLLVLDFVVGLDYVVEKDWYKSESQCLVKLVHESLSSAAGNGSGELWMSPSLICSHKNSAGYMMGDLARLAASAAWGLSSKLTVSNVRGVVLLKNRLKNPPGIPACRKGAGMKASSFLLIRWKYYLQRR